MIVEEVLQLKDELVSTKKQLYDRDQQLLKLHREIHKLKSVLEQTSSTQKQSSSSTSSACGPIKKCGVSSECFSSEPLMPMTQILKDYHSKQLIKEALLDNSFLRQFLNMKQLNLIIDAMYEKDFVKGYFICKQGHYGSNLYVIAYGHCEIIDSKNQLVNQLGPGKAFGELAILYNCARTASVKGNGKLLLHTQFSKIFIYCKLSLSNQLYFTFIQLLNEEYSLSAQFIIKSLCGRIPFQEKYSF